MGVAADAGHMAQLQQQAQGHQEVLEDEPSTIFVGGVSASVNEKTLQEFMECCGPLKSLKLSQQGLLADGSRQFTVRRCRLTSDCPRVESCSCFKI